MLLPYLQDTQSEYGPITNLYEDSNTSYSRIFGVTGQFVNSLLGQGEELSNSSSALNVFEFTCQPEQVITGFRAVGVPISLNLSSGTTNRVLITRLQASRQFLCHRLYCTNIALLMQIAVSSPCTNCHCRWCAWCQAALWQSAFKPVQPPVSSVTRPPALVCRIMRATAVGLARCATTGSA